jgi:hypothetical protein
MIVQTNKPNDLISKYNPGEKKVNTTRGLIKENRSWFTLGCNIKSKS